MVNDILLVILEHIEEKEAYGTIMNHEKNGY